MIYKNDNEWYTQIKDVEYFVRYIFNPNIKGPFIEEDFTIWCPFDTKDSAFVRVLESAGYNVIHSHIEEGKDFYTYEPEEEYDYIISNPPFKSKHKLLKRIKELKQKKPFFFLITINMVNNGEFMREWESFEWKYLCFLSRRVYYSKDIKTLEPAGRPSFNSLWLIGSETEKLPLAPIKTYEGAK